MYEAKSQYQMSMTTASTTVTDDLWREKHVREHSYDWDPYCIPAAPLGAEVSFVSILSGTARYAFSSSKHSWLHYADVTALRDTLTIPNEATLWNIAGTSPRHYFEGDNLYSYWYFFLNHTRVPKQYWCAVRSLLSSKPVYLKLAAVNQQLFVFFMKYLSLTHVLDPDTTNSYVMEDFTEEMSATRSGPKQLPIVKRDSSWNSSDSM